MATLAHYGERFMNGKKLAALAFVVSLAASTLPTFAGTPVPKTVTVQWNTQAIASLTLTTQGGATSAHGASENIYQAISGAGTAAGCAGDVSGTTPKTLAGADTSGNGTVNFGAVTPDGTQSVYCLEINAVNAQIATNDTAGYTVTEEFTAGTPGGYGTNQNVCLYADGAYANGLAYTPSGRSAAITTATASTCPTGFTVPVSPAVATTLVTSVGSTASTNLNADMELFVGANAPTNNVSATLTYTLTPT